MLFFSYIPSDDELPPPRRLARTGAVMFGVLVTLMGGLLLFFMRSPVSATLPVILVLITLFGVGFMIYALSAAKAARSADKPKRSQPGMDMYTMIDRMVDELDPDELDYLRRRLDERGDDLVASVNDLLDERDGYRRQQ